MKQFHINAKCLPKLDHRQSATGIVLGTRQTLDQKAPIYDILLTPDPETTQEDLRKLNPQGNSKKSLIELLNTKYPDFNYTEWVTEYKNALEKSLTTGIEILGLFVYA